MTEANDIDPIDSVADLMIEGRPHAFIIDFLASRDIDRDDAVLIIEQALAKFVKAASMPAAIRKGWLLEALRELYRRQLKAGDFAGALGALKEIAKLSALYTTGISDDTKNEIDAYIDEIMTLS